MRRHVLLTPGPATTTETVKLAQVATDLCPREAPFQEILDAVRRGLQKIATKDEGYRTVLFGASGTAAIESVISSAIPESGEVLIIDNGFYAERMVGIAARYKIGVVRLSFTPGTSISLSAIEQALQKNPGIAMVAMVHNETSSGQLNPIASVGELVRSFNKLYLVDAMSSFGGLVFDAVECNIDFLVASSNKCLQAMPGVSFVICRLEALEKIAANRARSYYLDLVRQYQFLEEKGQTPFTPPVQTILALKQAISEFASEGAQNREDRYVACWRELTSGLRNVGLRLLLPNEHQSKLITAICLPTNPRFEYESFHLSLVARGFSIYPGIIESQNTFRIGNIGAIDIPDVQSFLRAAENELALLGLGATNLYV